jgi:hypothetical protein
MIQQDVDLRASLELVTSTIHAIRPAILKAILERESVMVTLVKFCCQSVMLFQLGSVMMIVSHGHGVMPKLYNRYLARTPTKKTR